MCTLDGEPDYRAVVEKHALHKVVRKEMVMKKEELSKLPVSTKQQRIAKKDIEQEVPRKAKENE